MSTSSIGLGFINWQTSDEALDAAISCRPGVIWLAFPSAGREFDTLMPRLKEAGCKVLCMVQTLDQAEQVVRACFLLLVSVVHAQYLQAMCQHDPRAQQYCQRCTAVSAVTFADCGLSARRAACSKEEKVRVAFPTRCLESRRTTSRAIRLMGATHVQVLLGADAVVAQGNEAGGHGALGGASVLTLTPAIVDSVAAASLKAGLEQPVPVLAAGER